MILQRLSILRYSCHISTFQMFCVWVSILILLGLFIPEHLAKAQEGVEGGLRAGNKGSLEIQIFSPGWMQGFGEIDFTVDDAGQITSTGGTLEVQETTRCKTNYNIEVNNLHGQVIEEELKPPLDLENISDFLSKLKVRIYLMGIYQSPQWICPDPDDNWTDPPVPWGPFELTFPMRDDAMIELGQFTFVLHPPKCFFPPTLKRKFPATVGCSSQCIEHKKKQYEGSTHDVEIPNPSAGSPYQDVWPAKPVNLNSGHQFGGLTFLGGDSHGGIIVSYKSPVIGLDCVKKLTTGEFREQIHRRALQDKNLLDDLTRLHR